MNYLISKGNWEKWREIVTLGDSSCLSNKFTVKKMFLATRTEYLTLHEVSGIIWATLRILFLLFPQSFNCSFTCQCSREHTLKCDVKYVNPNAWYQPDFQEKIVNVLITQNTPNVLGSLAVDHLCMHLVCASFPVPPSIQTQASQGITVVFSWQLLILYNYSLFPPLQNLSKFLSSVVLLM